MGTTRMTRVFTIVRLAMLLFSSQVLAATVEEVKLVGEFDSYINLKSKTPNKLVCNYRTGYDDPVIRVNWYKDGKMTYTWEKGDTISTAYGDLIGKVLTSTKSDLNNIYFTNFLSLSLSGNYTCEVISEKGQVRTKPFHLVILDIPSDEYLSNVTLLSDRPMGEETSADDLKNCTLLWDFQTPAIFPRPNVTCGYYSYLHDDVTNSVPAGLTMHLLGNGSWQASFERTQVQVAQIPPNKRLGCSVSVPETTFKRIVKFEDNFALDYLIDVIGCPLWMEDNSHRPQFEYDKAEMNCRGELVPASNDKPLTVRFWCKPDEMAVFTNGTILSSWSREIICEPADYKWQIFQDEGHTIPSPINMEKDLPHCIPNPNWASRKDLSSCILFLPLIFLLQRWILS